MSLGLRPGWFGIIVGWFGVVWGGGRPTAGRGHPKTIPKPSHKPSQNHPQTTAPTHHPPLDNCKYDSVLYGFVPTVSKPDAQYIYIYIYIYITNIRTVSPGPTNQRPGTLQTPHRPPKDRKSNAPVNFTRVLLNVTVDKHGPGQLYWVPGQLYCRQTSQVIK